MQYAQDLESHSSPKIRKAAHAIGKKHLAGYCPQLLAALRGEIKKPKAWKTQCELINAIGMTGCQEALPFLEELIDRDYESTVLYRELAFSIFLLRTTAEPNLDFLFRSIEKGNVPQISGACAGVLYKKIIPASDDIKRIIAGIAPYTADEGQIITPRGYIAAVAHLWPRADTQAFLESCIQSSWPALIEIAQDALQGKPAKIELI